MPVGRPCFCFRAICSAVYAGDMPLSLAWTGRIRLVFAGVALDAQHRGFLLDALVAVARVRVIAQPLGAAAAALASIVLNMFAMSRGS